MFASVAHEWAQELAGSGRYYKHLVPPGLSEQSTLIGSVRTLNAKLSRLSQFIAQHGAQPIASGARARSLPLPATTVVATSR
jgi:hypothetical protein